MKQYTLTVDLRQMATIQAALHVWNGLLEDLDGNLPLEPSEADLYFTGIPVGDEIDDQEHLRVDELDTLRDYLEEVRNGQTKHGAISSDS